MTDANHINEYRNTSRRSDRHLRHASPHESHPGIREEDRRGEKRRGKSWREGGTVGEERKEDRMEGNREGRKRKDRRERGHRKEKIKRRGKVTKRLTYYVFHASAPDTGNACE